MYEVVVDLQFGGLFAASLVLVLAGTKITKVLSFNIGRSFSKFRTGGSIPADCQDPLKTKLAMRKFSDQAWQLAIHICMTLYELHLMKNTTWWQDPSTAWDPCPHTFMPNENGVAENTHPLDLKYFYIIQLAIWVWTAFSCTFLESRRKDYLEMMLHHIFTISLVLSSYLYQEYPIGTLILFVHDSSDVVLDLMKMCNYLKLEDMHGFFITEIMFVTNTLVTWPYLRMYKFPYYIVYEGVLLAYGGKCGAEGVEGTVARCMSGGTCFTSFCFLSLLAFLHFYWYALFIRIAIRLLTSSASQAGKAEYEGNSGSEHLSDQDNNKKD